MDELGTLVREKCKLQWNMHYYHCDFVDIKVKIIISLIYVYKPFEGLAHKSE